MTLSIITPTTLERVSLYQTIDAVSAMRAEGDEHIVVIDGDTIPHWLPTPAGVTYWTCKSRKSIYGNAQRDLGMAKATGQLLVFLDDDDLPGKDAYDVLHALPSDNLTCHMFAMKYNGGATKDAKASIPFSQVGGPQLVVPNRPDLPKWMSQNLYEADFHFMRGCVNMLSVIEHPEIICYVGGHE